MNCEEVWNLISASMDGEIAPADRTVLEHHLAGCDVCRSVSDAFKVQDGELRRAFAPRRRAAGQVAGETIARLRFGGRRPRFRAWLLQTAAAAAAGFFVAVLLLRPSPEPLEEPPVARGGPEPAPARDLPVKAAPEVAKTPEPASPAGRAPDAKAAADIPVGVARLALVAAGREGAGDAEPAASVELMEGAAWRPLRIHEPLGEGARVRAPAGIICEFRLPDGSEVRLKDGTELVFEGRRKLRLFTGRVWSSVEREETPFQVASQDGTVTALGTKFEVQREEEEEGTLVTVVEGLTRVSGGAGEEIVRTGEVARIHEGTVQKRRAEVLIATNWVSRILALKASENHPEVVQRFEDLLASIGEAKMGNLYVPEVKALGESCVRPLLSYLASMRSKTNPERRRKAASILADIAPAWAVRELILLLADEERKVRSDAARALERLTGETQGRRPEEWELEPWEKTEETYRKWVSWWEENRSRFPASYPTTPIR